jgi:membrane associated rhomboid family serine protease
MIPSTPITTAILLITGIVSWLAFNNSALFDKLLNNPYKVKHQKQYYRILSHTLVHADIMHLALNLLVFYSFGQIMEISLKATYGLQAGSIYYLILYVVGAIAATLPSLRKHGDNYGYNSVGASGAVSAVMMAYMIFFPLSQLSFFFFIPMPAFLGVLVFFVFEHMMNRSGKTNIAHDAHIWGALFGILFVVVLDPNAVLRFFYSVKAYIVG